MTCREIQPVLARLAGCEGAPRIALEAARHLAGCPNCAETLLRLRNLNTLLDQLPALEVPRTFLERVVKALPRRVKEGGVALILGLLALGGVALSTRGAGATFWSGPGSPLESAGTTLAALYATAQEFLDVVLTAVEAAQIPLPRIPGAPALISLPLAALTILAALMLMASAAAFGGGVLSLKLERRTVRHPQA